MLKKYIREVMDNNISCLAIIGMAKNSGKTVAFNTLLKEGSSLGLKMALISFGRDGEEIDSLTLKKKPRIKLSPGNLFVTAEKVYQASGIKGENIRTTGFFTPFGEVNIYMAKERGNIELIGVNSISQLQKLKTYLPQNIDMILIDGALDRRSSAVPNLSEGIILSTGAVLGNTIDIVLEKTIYEIHRLSIPSIEGDNIRNLVKRLLDIGKNALIDRQGKVKELESSTSFSLGVLKEEFRLLTHNNFKTLILKGALVDRLAKDLIYNYKIRDFTIIVRDGTRIFLSKNVFNLLERFNIELRVLDEIKIQGLTVNPFSPYGVRLNSSKLVDNFRTKLQDIPVYDLMSDEYLSL